VTAVTSPAAAPSPRLGIVAGPLRPRTLLFAVALALPVLGLPERAATAAVAVDPTGDAALAAFQARHDQVMELVRKRAKPAAIEAAVDQLLDYDWLAKTSLGGADGYAAACGAKCEAFERVLTRLIRENYLRRLRSADKGAVEYVGVEVRGDAAKVSTRLTYTQDGKPQAVAIAYVMRQVDGTWRVQDIVTEGVSLARTYRHEFHQELGRGGIDGLIRKLEDKLAKLDG